VRAIHGFRVSTRLPEPLAPLSSLAWNLAAIADERVQDLFRRIDPRLWDADGVDALGLLGRVPQERLDALAADAGFVAAAAELADDLARRLTAPRWFQRERDDALGLVAYFSPEFGLAEALPQYSGGLGILAGDHLKAANDLGVPLVGLGLFYQHGYFQQTLDRGGWQHEHFRRLNPSAMALSLVPDLHVTVDLAGAPVVAQVWRAQVGRVDLYLLDTDVDANADPDRSVTDRLYGGGEEQRIRQEILLGIGGVRLLDALGLVPDVFHMNEGHAGFLALERIRRRVVDDGLSFEEAIEATRPAQLFTTHTPVPAGIDRFPRDLVERYFSGWAAECGVTVDTLMSLGQEPGTPEGVTLNLAAMSLRLAGGANGVSRLHGEVSRAMFAGLWPDTPVESVPIGSVTNGVHAPSWVSREMGDLLERTVGTDWPEAPPERWAPVEALADEELWAIRRTQRERLVAFARRRVRAGLLARGLTEQETEWCEDILDPGILTIGFARRFAPYKRATLLLRDRDRLLELLTSKKRPVQIIFAGKAHPADEPGKELLPTVAQLAMEVEWRNRFVFIEDYDMGVGRALVRGVDLWLNTPRRPLEACGTSGMKVALNGGLNCSVLDGWWAERYDNDIGWSIPSQEWIDDVEARDHAEAAALMTILEDEVVPTFYDRGDAGIPRQWLRMAKASLARLGPQISATRMLREYVDEWYVPARDRAHEVTADGFRWARELVVWRARVARCWPGVVVRAVHHDEQVMAAATHRVHPRLEVHTVGDMADGDLGDRHAGPQAPPHLTGHRAVQAADAVAVAGEPEGQHRRAERVVGVVGVVAAERDELLGGEPERRGERAEQSAGERRREVVVPCGDRGVGGEEDPRGRRHAGLGEREVAAAHRRRDVGERGDRGVPLVAVHDVGFDPEGGQGLVAADAEQQVLAEPQLGLARVQPPGDGPGGGRVAGRIGIDEDQP
jgi:starch phosphorylase